MKVRDFVKLIDAATENAEIYIENGEIVITEPSPIEYKFKVGDKVKITTTPDYCAHPNAIYEITELMERNGEPLYKIKYDGASYRTYERYLELAPQDITERIKTFKDACQWCNTHGKGELTMEYDIVQEEIGAVTKDILAYLKLRIITAALNEGWEPTFEDGKALWYVVYCIEDGTYVSDYSYICVTTPNRLMFKSARLAQYAAKQFRDIYADLYGCKKGGEQ